MGTHSYHIHVERVDPERRIARYYELAIEPSIHGMSLLVRRWGGIGTIGHVRVHHFDTEKQALRLFLELLKEKRGRGYKPRHVNPLSSREPWTLRSRSLDAAGNGQPVHANADG
ncbi:MULTISPECIES: WGR domain-containing protein [unclassified Rhizobium]|uniref:WGR domain-containing protein n=1 Tax=unclassified Rhizobium TaxID=2613769 RepID=UPI00135BAA99|nr:MULTISPECIES: WGR domain-containing protein [unclassified Rhizobium]